MQLRKSQLQPTYNWKRKLNCNLHVTVKISVTNNVVIFRSCNLRVEIFFWQGTTTEQQKKESEKNPTCYKGQEVKQAAQPTKA
jgi:hypothetical protein